MKKEDVLILLLKEKNEDAFEAIYDKYHKLVFLIINNIVRDSEVAKELTSDTFLRMYKGIDTFKIGNNFQPWLTTIAKNTAINYINRNKDQNLIYDETIVLNTFDEKPNYNIMGLISGSLDGLEYEVVKLKIIYNCTYKDISDLVNISTAEAFRKYKSGIEKIRKTLKDI